MNQLLIGFCLLGLIATSCSKKGDDGDDAPRVTVPSVGLVAPDNFKNTAKNGAEVAQKLNQLGTAASAVRLGARGAGNTSTSAENNSEKPVLDDPSVSSFLSDVATQTIADQKSAFRDGANCGEQLDTLNSVYRNGGAALQGAARTLEAFDGKLPEGVVRNTASDEFAVSYTIDLSKVQVDTSGQGSSSAAGRNQKAPKLTGQAKIAAGANDEAAVVALAVAASMTSQQNTAALNGELSAGAYANEKLMKLGFKNRLVTKTQDDKGNPVMVTANAAGQTDIGAGTVPFINLSISGNSNLDFSSGEPVPTNSMQDMSAQIRVEKMTNSDVAVTYKVVVQGKEQVGTMTFTTDQYGQCVVKNQGNTL